GVYELVRRAQYELVSRARDRHERTVSDRSDPIFSNIRPVIGHENSDPTLSDLVAAYKKRNARANDAPKSRLKLDAQLRMIKSITGELHPVADIDRKVTAQFVDVLSRLPANARKKFPKLSPLEAAKSSNEL